MCKRRSIPLSIILTFLTCGIYGIYWFVVLTNETNDMVPEGDRTAGGGLAFLFTLVSCGIYGIYWAYKLGYKLDVICAAHGRPAKSLGVIFLVLSLFGPGIINYALTQSELNNYAA